MRYQAVRLNEIYPTYRDRVQFLCVYIQEAHPDDGWQVPMNRDEGVIFEQPKTEEERVKAAGACALNLSLAMPMALDDMGNTVDTAYAALPERLYLINPEGRIVHRSGPGPWGFDIDAWESAIRGEIDRNFS